MLARLGLRSGAPMDKIVENLHVLPSYLVAIQDYKAKPSKVTFHCPPCCFSPRLL